MFDHHGRQPWAALNFITSHDGFTLQDWVSYQSKHNEANGEQNRDGSDDNASNNWGIEGPTDDPAVQATRARVKRSMLAMLFCSHGTPMLLGGDEFGRTQQGNNNPYCLDSELSWFDWEQVHSPAGLEQQALVARLTQLRREYRSLRSRYFQHGLLEPLAQVRDLEWFDENGDVMRSQDWQNSEARFLCVRRGVRLDEKRAELSLLLINNTAQPQKVQFPQPAFRWWRRLDTAEARIVDQEIDRPSIDMAAHSVQLFTTIVDASAPDSLPPGAAEPD